MWLSIASLSQGSPCFAMGRNHIKRDCSWLRPSCAYIHRQTCQKQSSAVRSAVAAAAVIRMQAQTAPVSWRWRLDSAQLAPATAA